ncbi:protein QUIRKY-like [Canna indica]|uniref:Protein QUIRKY-like n=1 Tax=Canna indica TaxID=4628 RepID=A0AAQ3L257_9LILI|nr:protein QUIRKY-like [Canna indica]
MVRNVLAIPVSTVAYEYVFSTGGRVLDHFRSFLSPKMIEALICAQNWLSSRHFKVDEEFDQFESTDKIISVLVPTNIVVETQIPAPPAVVVVEESPPPTSNMHADIVAPPSPEPTSLELYPSKRPRVSRRSLSRDYGPLVIIGRFVSSSEFVDHASSMAYDLVEPMHYLFVNVVKARGLCPCESPHVKIKAGMHSRGHSRRGTAAEATRSGTRRNDYVGRGSVNQRCSVARLRIGVDGLGGVEAERAATSGVKGGYHVPHEAVHVCNDFQPTAKQLWKPVVGVLELGILGARGLLPMKMKGSGDGVAARGSTDT